VSSVVVPKGTVVITGRIRPTSLSVITQFMIRHP